MNTKSFILPALIFMAMSALVSCGGVDDHDVRQDSARARVNAPAPDNNSANNPSMADTAFQKDSARKKDSVH